jgi:hypothetical protein
MPAPSIRLQTADADVARCARLLSALRGVQVSFRAAGALLLVAELLLALGGG